MNQPRQLKEELFDDSNSRSALYTKGKQKNHLTSTNDVNITSERVSQLKLRKTTQLPRLAKNSVATTKFTKTATKYEMPNAPKVDLRPIGEHLNPYYYPIPK